MRVLFSVLGYKPAWRIGGPAVSVPALAEALVRRGHEVTVFTTNSNLETDLDVPTDRVLNVDGVNVRYFRRAGPLKRFLPKLNYFSLSAGTLYAPEMPAALTQMAPQVDLMHTHLPFCYPTLATAKAAFRHRVPLFYHQRGVLDPARLQFRALKKRAYLSLVEKSILRRATTLIALTEAEVKSYQALQVGTPCQVVPNGIDVVSPLPGARAAQLLAELRIEPRHQVILFMARLHPIKGADRLLEAFMRIAPHYPDALLVLAGPDEFAIEAEFKSRVRATGLADRVVFPGLVSGDFKEALLERADLFSLPSDAEGFSMAVLEALAHGTAVLLSPGCNFPEAQAAHAGLIAAPTADAIEEALGRLLANPVQLRDMGRAGLDLVRRDYTWDSIAGRMVDVYGEGIERHRSALQHSRPGFLFRT